MATLSPDFTERRHMPDRRTTNSAMRRDMTEERKMTAGDWIPMILLIVGGLNWGLVGLLEFDLVAFLFGEGSTVSRAVYVIVGLCALYALYLSARMSSSRMH